MNVDYTLHKRFFVTTAMYVTSFHEIVLQFIDTNIVRVMYVLRHSSVEK